jgi:hypothetical protein
VQSACLLEHSQQSGIANCVRLVSFVACQHDVMKNNVICASTFLHFHFILFSSLFLYFLPSFHRIFVPDLFLLFHSLSLSRIQSTTASNCSCSISNSSAIPVISTKADCCLISKSSVLYRLANILPTFWESMVPSLPSSSWINHSSCLPDPQTEEYPSRNVRKYPPVDTATLPEA